MGKVFEAISPELTEWLEQQRLFFVASAPLGAAGHINCSPKGMDTFRILGPATVAYVDLTGSGIETVAHLRENGRVVFMFCAFEGAPRIVRLHGRGEVISPLDTAWPELRARFPEIPGIRAIVRSAVHRISDSCGYAVPKFEYREERDTLRRWCEAKSPAQLLEYRGKKNARSLDGLPGLEPQS